jgi:DNA-binding transcriptional MerR regulator
MSGKSGHVSDSGTQDSILGKEDEGTHEDARDRPLANAQRLTLGELTAAADVSVRTVRYYIAEGLLPPAEGSGPGSAYTQGHLDRLRLIQRLKEAYLPLKEIRRRLSGLSDDEVRSLLAANDFRAAPAMSPTSEPPFDESLAGARHYLALLESREQYRTEPIPNGADGSPVSGRRRATGGRSGWIRFHTRASAKPGATSGRSRRIDVAAP